jgi:hypothetical protein
LWSDAIHLMPLYRRFAPGDKERIAVIHPPSESKCSRKPLFSFAHPYALGPGICALSPRSRTLGAGTLIHPRIKIRSRLPRRPLLDNRVNRGRGSTRSTARRRLLRSPDSTNGSRISNQWFVGSAATDFGKAGPSKGEDYPAALYRDARFRHGGRADR